MKANAPMSSPRSGLKPTGPPGCAPLCVIGRLLAETTPPPAKSMTSRARAARGCAGSKTQGHGVSCNAAPLPCEYKCVCTRSFQPSRLSQRGPRKWTPLYNNESLCKHVHRVLGVPFSHSPSGSTSYGYCPEGDTGTTIACTPIASAVRAIAPKFRTSVTPSRTKKRANSPFSST